MGRPRRIKRRASSSVEQPVPLLCWPNALPIGGHINDQPPLFRAFVQAAIELSDGTVTVIGKLSLAFGVTDDPSQKRTIASPVVP